MTAESGHRWPPVKSPDCAKSGRFQIGGRPISVDVLSGRPDEAPVAHGEALVDWLHRAKFVTDEIGLFIGQVELAAVPKLLELFIWNVGFWVRRHPSLLGREHRVSHFDMSPAKKLNGRCGATASRST